MLQACPITRRQRSEICGVGQPVPHSRGVPFVPVLRLIAVLYLHMASRVPWGPKSHFQRHEYNYFERVPSLPTRRDGMHASRPRDLGQIVVARWLFIGRERSLLSFIFISSLLPSRDEWVACDFLASLKVRKLFDITHARCLQLQHHFIWGFTPLGPENRNWDHNQGCWPASSRFQYSVELDVPSISLTIGALSSHLSPTEVTIFCPFEDC